MTFTWRALRNDSRSASGHGPLYATVDPEDKHQQALREVRQLNDEKWNVLVAYPTLLEAYSLILFRLGERRIELSRGHS
jgi:hypothetical protein